MASHVLPATPVLHQRSLGADNIDPFGAPRKNFVIKSFESFHALEKTKQIACMIFAEFLFLSLYVSLNYSPFSILQVPLLVAYTLIHLNYINFLKDYPKEKRVDETALQVFHFLGEPFKKEYHQEDIDYKVALNSFLDIARKQYHPSRFTRHPCQAGRIKKTGARYIALNFKESSSGKIRTAVFFENSCLMKKSSFSWYYVCEKVDETSLPIQIDNFEEETAFRCISDLFLMDDKITEFAKRLMVFKFIVNGTNREFRLATAEELAELNR